MSGTTVDLGLVLLPPPPPEVAELPVDLDHVLTAARRWGSAAQATHENQLRLTATTDALLGHRLWCGPASESFGRSSGTLARWLQNAAQTLAGVAAALLAYARAAAVAVAATQQACALADDLRTRRADLVAEVEQATTGPGRPTALFGVGVFAPSTVALQGRADALAAEVRRLEVAVDTARADFDAAGRALVAALDQAATLTYAARREQLLAARAGGETPSRWQQVAEIVGLGVSDLVLGAVDLAQGGLDPVTDAAEAAALARTASVAGRLIGETADDASATLAEAGTAQGSWLDAAQARLPDAWGSGEPARLGSGTRWIEPEGPGTYLRVDPGRATHSDPLQRVDHVHIRREGTKIGRGGVALPRSPGDLTPDELAELVDLEHVPLSEWLTWKEWWRP